MATKDVATHSVKICSQVTNLAVYVKPYISENPQPGPKDQRCYILGKSANAFRPSVGDIEEVTRRFARESVDELGAPQLRSSLIGCYMTSRCC